MADQILRILVTTFLKLRPEQSSTLSENELQQVSAGSTFELQSYAYADANGDFDGHIKIALKNLSFKGLNTWFVYSNHVHVEQDGVVVYPTEDQEVIPILRTTRDTVFKRRPVQSSVLSDAQKQTVPGGTSLPLHSYAYADARGDFSSHMRIAIRYEQDYLKGLSTWYVYDQHGYIEVDGDVVYPPEDPKLPVLRVTRDTLFKRQPLQSSQLKPEELYSVPKGSLWKLHSYAYADAKGSFSSHIKFALRYEKDFIRYLSTWYVYDGHAQVEVQGTVVYPLPSAPTVPTNPTDPTPPTIPVYSGRPFKLPGNSSTFYTDQPIIPGGNFTWGEATKEATRIPDSTTIVNNIIALAEQLQRAREQIGQPFLITSWYRPPAINAAVGGARYSQHLYGKAADIQVSGYSGRRAANAVMLWWPGGVGIYSNIPSIVHLDIGPRRVWGF